jgi:C-5 cytosine-specific DNA methylase
MKHNFGLIPITPNGNLLKIIVPQNLNEYLCNCGICDYNSQNLPPITAIKLMKKNTTSGNQVKVGCLFAAIGGFCRSFQEVGASVAWANEKDKFAADTFKPNEPKNEQEIIPNNPNEPKIGARLCEPQQLKQSKTLTYKLNPPLRAFAPLREPREEVLQIPGPNGIIILTREDARESETKLFHLGRSMAGEPRNG